MNLFGIITFGMFFDDLGRIISILMIGINVLNWK